MSKINTNAFSFLYDGKILTTKDLKDDRELIANAVNDNQSQIAHITFGNGNINIFDTKALLDSYSALLLDGEFAIVLVDESVSNNTNLYKKISGVLALEAEDFYLANMFNVFSNRVVESFEDTIIVNTAIDKVPLTINAIGGTTNYLQRWNIDGELKAYLSETLGFVGSRFSAIEDDNYFLDPTDNILSLNVAGNIETEKDIIAGGNITANNLNITNWDESYGWGDHSGLYALAGQVLTDVPLGAVFTDTWRDIVDDLTTGGTEVSLSAAQGVVLKGYIESINTLLTSDNLSLDSLQEIVDYIESNNATLTSLDITSILGLQTSLDNKVDDSQVLTDVPIGALFTDTIYTLSQAKIEEAMTSMFTMPQTINMDGNQILNVLGIDGAPLTIGSWTDLEVVFFGSHMMLSSGYDFYKHDDDLNFILEAGKRLTVNGSYVYDEANPPHEIASTEEAEAGTDNDTIMTPLRVAQAGGTFPYYGDTLNGGTFLETPTETVTGGTFIDTQVDLVIFGGRFV